MNNPFLHSSLSSYSNYQEWHPQSGYTNSRTLNQLELSIPINLLNDYPISSPQISSRTRLPASQKYAAFPLRQSRPASNVLQKENPFLTAKPYRLSDRTSGGYTKNALAGWQKRRYLQRFMTENPQNDQPISGYAYQNRGRQQENKRADMGKSEKAYPTGSKSIKRMFTFQPDNQNEQPLARHQPNYSFSNEDSSFQLAYNPTYAWDSKGQHHNGDLIQDSVIRKIIRKPSDQESLIHKLDSNAELKSMHLKTTNSKIVEYPGEENQYQDYYRPNIRTSQRPSIPVKEQEQGRKLSIQQSHFQSETKVHQPLPHDYPTSIRYRNTTYQYIRLI